MAEDIERLPEQHCPKEAAERAQRFRMIFEHARDAVFLVEPAKDLILDVSPSACALLGYSCEELIGMAISDVHPEEMDQLMLFAQQATVHGGASTTELSCLTKSGRLIPAEISANFYQDKLGRNLMIAQVRDISERVAAEQAKHDLEETLRHAQKMEAVGQLAGGIAHDFNNILTIINFYSEELLDRADTATDKEDLETILMAGQRGSELTRQLLSFSRKQEVQARVVYVNESILNAKKMWRRVIGEHIDLQVHLGPEDARIFIDRGQFDQVLMNLIVNARDAMPAGGQIRIDIEIEESADNRLYAKVSVSDNGSGMDEATQKRIFDPFFTTKEVGKGTGLGLATVYAIIDQHGGHLSVVSEVGKGSCFSIRLPLAESKTTVKFPPRNSLLPEISGAAILVVEDEPAVRAMVVTALARAGYHVFEADNGESGTEFVTSCPGIIDLLVTDVVMPKASGWIVAEAYLKKYENGAVLFMSGYADRKAEGAELLLRHQPLLSKPFRRTELLTAVAKKLEGATLQAAD